MHACASTTPAPQELADARASYARLLTADAATERAGQDRVRAAKVALDIAEAAYLDNPDGQETRDRAVVAEQKFRLAEANASSAPASPAEERTDASPQNDYR